MNAVQPVDCAPAIRPPTVLTLLSFLAIYFIWGSTFLAIKVAVALVPPFLAAALRFIVAGSLLLLFAYLRRMPMPTAREWRNLVLSGVTIFVPSFAGLFWAERTMPSGIAAALAATIPVWMALGEVFVLKRAALHWSLLISALCGIAGVCLLSLRGINDPAHSILPYVVVFIGHLTWTVGSLLTKSLQLPTSKPLVAGAQMASAGFALLLLSTVAGELQPMPHISPEAAFAILYLAIPGSVVAFTAYVWLLGHFPAAKVASYAYVNPLVALTLGWWLGHESLDARVLAGTALVLAAVLLTLRGQHAH